MATEEKEDIRSKMQNIWFGPKLIQCEATFFSCTILLCVTIIRTIFHLTSVATKNFVLEEVRTSPLIEVNIFIVFMVA